MSITKRLDELLIKNGIPKRSIKRELAAACGLSYEAVRKWYSGQSNNIRNDNLTAIAKKFNTTTDWILTGKEAKSNHGVPVNTVKTEDQNTISIPLIADKNTYGYNILIGVDMDLEALKKLIPCKDYSKLTGASMPDDSMCKTIANGDPLLIDENYRSIETDGIYKVEYAKKTYIRRFQLSLSNDLRMIPDNNNYESYTITKDMFKDFIVIGKVVYMWCGQRV